MTHIQTYKEAKVKHKQKFKYEQSISLSNLNFVSVFFEIEMNSSPKKTSRKQISMEPLFEKGIYSQQGYFKCIVLCLGHSIQDV